MLRPDYSLFLSMPQTGLAQKHIYALSSIHFHFNDQAF